MVDPHQHCACNGVLLCGTCHEWVHGHPFEARKQGFIVSRHTNEPEIIPVLTTWGWRSHDCNGGFTAIDYDSGYTSNQN